RSRVSCGMKPASMRGGATSCRLSAARCRLRGKFKTRWGRRGGSGAGLTTAEMLTQIAACGELFHTATGTAFADIMVDGHRETWPIRSKRFRGWLRRRYYETTGSALSGLAISSELGLVGSHAQFDGCS